MDNLYTSKRPYEERILQAVKNGTLTAPLFFSIDPGTTSWESATKQEISNRIWHSTHSMQLSDEGFLWYKGLQQPFSITDTSFATAGAILGIVRIFPTTAFHLHRNTLHHWDAEKQNSWALCGGSLPQWLSLSS